MKPSGILVLVLIAIVFVTSSYSQTTAFNFQGRLNDGTSPANGSYDLQFKLFNALTGGIQIGPTVDRPNLVLVNGVFSTALDFGAAAFAGGDRFVEISVRPNGSPNAYVVLGARQQILAVPYTVRAATATQADNAQTAEVAANANALGSFPAGNYARLNTLNGGGFRVDGDAGFGPVVPNTRLTLSGGAPWTSNLWTASMNMQNGSALGWEANSSGQRFGVGQTNGGLYVFRTISGFGTTQTPAQVDLQITDDGNLAQPADKGGLVKAMVAITANGKIARCFNGVTGSTSCVGFSAECAVEGTCLVGLPVDFTSRFWLVNLDSSFFQLDSTDDWTASAGISNTPNKLRVFTRKNGTPTSLPFHLFLF